MNIDEILSSQAQLAYPVGIEETVRRLSQKKGKTINFSIGQSGPETIPYDYFREFFLSLSRASEEELKPLALYGATRGGSAGLEAVKKLAIKDGIKADETNICLSSGALEGFYLLTRALANKGDTVCCEAPTYSINLKSLEDLPTLAELKDLDQIHRELDLDLDNTAAAEEGEIVESAETDNTAEVADNADVDATETVADEVEAEVDASTDAEPVSDEADVADDTDHNTSICMEGTRQIGDSRCRHGS